MTPEELPPVPDVLAERVVDLGAHHDREKELQKAISLVEIYLEELDCDLDTHDVVAITMAISACAALDLNVTRRGWRELCLLQYDQARRVRVRG